MSDLEKRLTQIALNPAYHDLLTIVKVSPSNLLAGALGAC